MSGRVMRSLLYVRMASSDEVERVKIAKEYTSYLLPFLKHNYDIGEDCSFIHTQEFEVTIDKGTLLTFKVGDIETKLAFDPTRIMLH